MLCSCGGGAQILDFSDPNWLRAELNGREGLVPSNYINIAPHAYALQSTVYSLFDSPTLWLSGSGSSYRV